MQPNLPLKMTLLEPVLLFPNTADMGVYTSKAFTDSLLAKGQTIQHSGVGGHHHNGVAENAIKNTVHTARTMMIHAALRWPSENDKELWPLALSHAVHLHNLIPAMRSKLSPNEIWSRSTGTLSNLVNAHPWGCPVYVLDPRLQDGKKIPKWEPQSRQGQYMGSSPLHASTVGLVRNLRTFKISPQFHVVYDDLLMQTLLFLLLNGLNWSRCIVLDLMLGTATLLICHQSGMRFLPKFRLLRFLDQNLFSDLIHWIPSCKTRWMSIIRPRPTIILRGRPLL